MSQILIYCCFVKHAFLQIPKTCSICSGYRYIVGLVIGLVPFSAILKYMDEKCVIQCAKMMKDTKNLR